MEIRIETELFRSLVKAVCMNGQIETPVMVFNKDYMEAVNRDIANVSMSVCRVEKDSFLEYNVTEEEKITIEAEKTLKLIRNLTGDEITMEKTDNSLLIRTTNEKLKIPIMEGSGSSIKLPETILIRNEDGIISVAETMEHQIRETIPVLKKEVEGLGEDETIFEVENKELSVRQETTDGYSFQSSIKKDVDAENFSVTFNTDYLKAIFSSVIDEEVLLNLGKGGVPMILENNTDGYQILLVLLPRINVDD